MDPDAFFALNDALAIIAIERLERMGINIPDDVAIAGIGDLPVAAMSRINLTTAHEPREQIGRKAAEIMLELIKNPKHKPMHIKIKYNELKIRKSSVRQ